MEFIFAGTDVINFFMIAFGIGVSCLSMIQIRKSPIDKQVKRYFCSFLWLVITYIAMYLIRMLLVGHPGVPVRTALRTVTIVEFLVSGFITFMLVLMIMTSAGSGKFSKKALLSVQGILVFHIIMLVIANFTDLYYYFDADNIYHRSKLYILSNLPPVAMMVYGMYLLITCRENISKRIKKAYWIYLIAPLIASVIQIFASDIKFIVIATVGAAVNMFAVITDALTEKYEKQQLEASRIDAELSMATRIQADMLPNIFPAFPERDEFDVYATMNPAKEVGGDFYDFFLIDDDHLGIVMADVSGKGVPAALFMMASKILIQNYTIVNKDPRAALEATNYQICQSNREEMFVTVWLGILDINTGLLTASNAGHEYPVLKHKDGGFELFKDKHGVVVGAMEGVRYRNYEMQMEKGSMLFLYTDGVAEATNASNKLFGTDRLVEALNSTKDPTPQNILASVEKAVSEFVKDAPQFDDLTMLCIKYNGKKEQ
ncbi:MAG: PP2C family protein-serine/threonine phosphatase [Ruminococcus sp.]|nr:PP2C family protein-serine/threonine phosphatase [Ruminococcus sp.]